MSAPIHAKTNEQLVAEYQAGSRAALDLLITRNNGLIFRVALRSLKSSEHEDFDDLYQELQIVFFHSAEKFDCERGVKFSTYVVHAMRFRVIQLWTERNRKKRTAPLASLDAPLRGATTLLDFLEDEKQIPADDKASQDEWLVKIKKAMKRIDRRSEAIVKQRMKGETLEEIAKQFGVCKERVRQLEQKALNKIRSMCGIPTECKEKPAVDVRKNSTEVVAENLEFIVERYNAGDSPNAIGEILLVDGNTIRRKLKALGIFKDGRLKKRRTTKQERYIRRLKKRGCCLDCPKPKLEGSAYCEYHQERRREAVRRARKR